MHVDAATACEIGTLGVVALEKSTRLSVSMSAAMICSSLVTSRKSSLRPAVAKVSVM